MNYLRGAVNAISAPYQYYKELPPINPSTLTGAIDVIVIQRPTGDGDTELACSPFHVRFGKWQVLRPGEKQVTVSVNGHAIPYLMKIGEAGEAFFVFETEDDIPENLITSPILQPTRPDEPSEESNGGATDQPPHDHPAPQPPSSQGPEDHKLEQEPAEQAIHLTEKGEDEPDFLDLNALPSPPEEEESESPTGAGAARPNTTPRQSFHRPSFLPRSPSQATLRHNGSLLPSPPPTPRLEEREHGEKTDEMQEQDQRIDEALKVAKKNLHVPEVEYHHDVALDMEGYHSHLRDSSDRTIRSSSTHDPDLHHPQPHPSHLFRATFEPPPDHDSPTASPSRQRLELPSSSSSVAAAGLSPVQEYSWEWGAFPQPSPVATTFGPWSKSKMAAMNRASVNLEGIDVEMPSSSRLHHHHHHHHAQSMDAAEMSGGHRSRSVPPELDGSPARDRKGKELPPEDDLYPPHTQALYTESPMEDTTFQQPHSEKDDEDQFIFGKDGMLGVSKNDPYVFILELESRKFSFELSLVPDSVLDPSVESAISGVVKDKDGDGDASHGVMDVAAMSRSRKFHVLEEVESSRLFGQGRFSYKEFLADERYVEDEDLVVKWLDERYITRDAGSPLMASLPIWRSKAVKEREEDGARTRATSPTPEGGEGEGEEDGMELEQPPDEHPKDRFGHNRSKSEPPEKMKQGAAAAAAAAAGGRTSWVQWFRSRKTSTMDEGERPELMKTSSAPKIGDGRPAERDTELRRKDIPHADSAPAYPSTPVQAPIDANGGIPIPTNIPSIVQPTPESPPPTGKKYAKTLRLTSDQLKGLNLKPGANTMTFSLSKSGVVAATARIFVWDSSDLVVVSDIDGTITKSDGLGHVFAMIGRDWTHVGVAKLYTDIARNGYKIMYLTSRAIGQADATRDYLKGIKQNDYQLPEGPVIMSPDRLMASLHREVIMRKPEVFKMACLRDIQRLFGEASRNPFYAGFGNRITDALSYRSVDIPSARIFTIDSAGEVKMELLELAGYRSSYIHMTDLVDQMFPPIHRKWAPEYTDLNYWKQPIQEFPLPDLSPPSPALSARSDTTLSRLKNFSLRASSPPVGETTPGRKGRDGREKEIGSRKEGGGGGSEARDWGGNRIEKEGGEERSEALRQMSSFERLSSTLGFSSTSSLVDQGRRSASPGSYSSSSRSAFEDDSDDEDAALSGAEEGRKGGKRERRRSMTSMPGTLDDRHFDFDDEDEPVFGQDDEDEGGHYDDDEEHEEEHNIEDMVGDDLLAVEEIAEAPFL